MKMILIVLALFPSVGFGATDSLCARQVERSKLANANAEFFNAEYAKAQEIYARELEQNKSAIAADQAQLAESMKHEVNAEWALLDENLRAEGAKRTDKDGNLSEAYLRLRKETEIRIDVIIARYYSAMNEIAASYGAASFAKVSRAYEAALAATEEAQFAYESAMEACK